MNKKTSLDIPPKVQSKPELEVKAEVPPLEETNDEAAREEVSHSLPVIPAPVSDLSVEGDELDEDEVEDLEEAKEEASFEGEPFTPSPAAGSPDFGQQGYVEDLDNELGKFRLLVQGSDTRDSYLGNSLPFDMALANIKTPDERAIFRLDTQAYLEAATLFGRNSPLASELLQNLKTDIMISRADQALLSKLLVTTITYTDKKVSRSDKQSFENSPKTGLFAKPSPNVYGN